MRDHCETSAGLALRRWTPGDVQAVLTAFEDPVMSRQTVEPITSRSAAERWLTDRTDQWASGAAYAFAVVDAADLVLGNVSVGAVNHRHGTGWVSYWTTPAARGRGVASRACRTLARWSFDDLGLFRLELGHRLDNPASCKVALAAGFAAEGIERRKLEYDGARYDVERHARLASDDEPAGTEA
ncbi:GNAT family N-acetyltransferase [Streptomyces sp. NPDC048604]|uniref:GNAT family N-acetyltransferase n=1 Tax=Streptomyces sp. NPDC048604 TaxID=3365578 RepID=UPI0037221A22